MGKSGSGGEGEASKNNWAVVIAIIDSGGHLVMLHRRDDVQLSSLEIAQGKARTSLMFKRPSKVLDDAISGGGGGLGAAMAKHWAAVSPARHKPNLLHQRSPG